MWCCPHCGHWFTAESAWSGPEPDHEPGVLCPDCGAFISDEEMNAYMEYLEEEQGNPAD